MQRRMVLKVALAAVGLSIATAAPALATVVNVGGGTWNYETSYSFPTSKNVWSHYVNPSHQHSATAIGGPHNVKVYAKPNNWANADTQCGATESAAEYWNNY